MKQEELNKILEDHRLWLETRDTDEVKGAYLRGANFEGANLEEADFEGVNLRGADFEGAYLKGANFEGAYFKGVYFKGAYLRGANFEGVYLEDAYFEGADLRGADFERANLYRANFAGADLEDAYFEGANLEGVNFEGADLEDAYFKGADLKEVNFTGAYLRGADFEGVKNLPESLISYFKKDLRYVLTYTKSEIPYLKEKLEKGEVDGTQYEGECACLIGSLANAKKEYHEKFVFCIPDYELGLHNPSEQLFYQIRKGDTPENNQFAKIAMEVIEEFN